MAVSVDAERYLALTNLDRTANLCGVTKVNTGFRLESETVAELEELAALMSARAGGAKVNTSEAARAALRRGIAVLRDELGAPKKEAKKAARKPQK